MIEVQVLVRDRRDRDPERLREDDVAEPLEAREADRVRRLALAARHGQDAPADDLGDVARRVERERDEERRVLRREPEAAARRELARPRACRASTGGRRATKPTARMSEEDAAGPEHAVVGLARAVEAAGAPDPDADGRRERDEGDEPEGDAARRPCRTTGPRCPRFETTSRSSDLDGVADRRQADDHAEVPEEDDHEHRDVAERLDVERRGLADEPVRRQARDADEDAEDRGEHDPQRARP